MVYRRDQLIRHFRQQDFRIRKELRRFPPQNIPLLRDIAVTQDHLMVIGHMEQSLCRSRPWENQCGEKNVCIDQYPYFTVPFRNELRLQEPAHPLHWKYP